MSHAMHAQFRGVSETARDTVVLGAIVEVHANIHRDDQHQHRHHNRYSFYELLTSHLSTFRFQFSVFTSAAAPKIAASLFGNSETLTSTLPL